MSTVLLSLLKFTPNATSFMLCLSLKDFYIWTVLSVVLIYECAILNQNLHCQHLYVYMAIGQAML